MLIVLAWHQILNKPHATSIDLFINQIKFLKKEFDILSEPIFKLGTIQLLLTFDDATFDFFLNVYPILKEENIFATLGIPTFWIQNQSNLDNNFRLNLLNSKNPFYSKDCFCSWNELKILQSSNIIKFASHGHHHFNIKYNPNIKELITPLKQIKTNLDVIPKSFIFPYGAYNKSLLPALKENYKYLFRIGSASNLIPKNTFIYRVIVDNLENISSLFTKKSISTLIGKEVLNRIRFY